VGRKAKLIRRDHQLNLSLTKDENKRQGGKARMAARQASSAISVRDWENW
jgi:hypothetical protein